MNSGRQTRDEFPDERVHFVCYVQGVAFGLAIHVEKHGRFAIRGHHRIDRSDRRRDSRDVTEAEGNASGRSLDHNLSNLFRSAHLPADETQYELMTMLDQARRIDEIRAFDGVQDVRDGNPRSKEACRIRCDLKFGNAAALYDDCRNAIEPVEARLKVVGGNLPQFVRRQRV